jgi:hypothetical protein
MAQLPSIWIAEVTVRCPHGRKKVPVVGPTPSAAIRKGADFNPWSVGSNCSIEGVEIVRRGPGAGLAGSRRRKCWRRR